MGKYLDTIHQHDQAQMIIEPAAPQTRSVFWEQSDGSITGPGQVASFGKTATGDTERFWVIIEFQHQTLWVLSDHLRSRAAFKEQPALRVVERIPRSL